MLSHFGKTLNVVYQNGLTATEVESSRIKSYLLSSVRSSFIIRIWTRSTVEIRVAFLGFYNWRIEKGAKLSKCPQTNVIAVISNRSFRILLKTNSVNMSFKCIFQISPRTYIINFHPNVAFKFHRREICVLSFLTVTLKFLLIPT